jgi:hypothetical protein
MAHTTLKIPARSMRRARTSAASTPLAASSLAGGSSVSRSSRQFRSYGNEQVCYHLPKKSRRMSEQFPADNINGEQRPIVHIWTSKFDANKGPELASRATDLLTNVGAKLEGFLEGQILESDDGNTVIVLTTWKTRHAWASALWNEKVDQLLEVVEESSKVTDFICHSLANIGPAKA